VTTPDGKKTAPRDVKNLKYVDVIIDNNTDNTDMAYTYACAFDDVRPGARVFVPFTKWNKERPGFVVAVRDELLAEVKGLKEVSGLDGGISLDEGAVEICEWMRRRYFCRYIEAIRCFLPAGSPSKRGKTRKPALEGAAGFTRPSLTGEQEEALGRLTPWLDKRAYRTFLLHGVTGSGKTELYLRAAERALAMGRTALALVPEISLTPQTIGRFVARFGEDSVAALHSKLSLGERHDEWLRIRNGGARIVIGARSAVFAPLKNIGLIVVDEEHESSYKSDTAPKYDTIEVAVRRARQQGAVALLGSATPSLVSDYRAGKGYYERLRLKERYNKNPLPAVSVVDMREELRNGNKTVFSVELYKAASEALSVGKQVILFLNRRGYAPFISCRSCGYVMKCPDCEISLTYHMDGGDARCHYCGRRARAPEICPECGGRHIKLFGAGTEKVEESARKIFPDVPVARLDTDTASSKDGARRILSDFKKGRTRILIGTQMVAKGLDFGNVGFVGVISADVTLNVPDFRAAERTFQLITQAAGRAGRGETPGNVVVQTYAPGHFAVEAAAAHDYAAFREAELPLREAMLYPPFSDLALVTVAAKEQDDAKADAERLADALRTGADEDGRRRVLGPRPAAVFRNDGCYRYQIIVKVPPADRLPFEGRLREAKDAMLGDKNVRSRVMVDINPGSFM
jgi:primosomal protein N' (replication factor Y)